MTGMLVFDSSELSSDELSAGLLTFHPLDCHRPSSRSAASCDSRRSICGSASCGRWGFNVKGQSLEHVPSVLQVWVSEK